MTTPTNLGFVPTGTAAAPISGAGPVPNNLGFVPDQGQVAGASTQAPATGGSGLGAFALGLGKGALNLIDNNPISKSLISLAALPTQGLAKVLGQPDPFANGAMGKGALLPNGIGVTSTDQPLGQVAEQEAGNALNVGSLFVPAGKIAEAASPFLAPVLGRFAPAAARIGVNTALGAGQGLAGAMQDGQSGSQIKSSIGTGALLGGGLATAGEFGSALINNFAANTAETRLGEQVNRLKTLQNSFDDNSTFMKDPATGKMVATSDPIKTLTSTGLIKGLTVVDGRVNTEAVDSGIQDALAAQDKRATELVAGIPGQVTLSDFRTAAEDAVKNNPQIRDAGKVATALGEVGRRFDDYAESFGENMTYPQLNNIRIAMNREFNPEARDVARTIGDTARGMLYDAETGSPELKQVMGQQGQMLKAQNFVDRLRGTVVRGGRLGKYLADMVGSGVGTAMGSTLGPFGMGVGAVAGGAAADKAMSMYQNNFFNPLLTRPARALQAFGSAPATQAIARVGQAALIPKAVQQ